MISNGFTILSWVMLFVFLPAGYIWIYQQNLEKIQSKEFKSTWGYLYDGVSIKSSMHKIQFYVSFLLRRFVFVLLAFKVRAYFSLMGLLFLNIIMTIHLGHIRPFSSLYLNRIYLFNEYMIGVVSAHMLFYSDWIPSMTT